jgi:DUF1680 family protein
MSADGSDWAKYSPLMGERSKGEEQCGMGMNCCVASGPRGLFSLPRTLVMNTKEGVQVNFFSEGTFRLRTPKNQKIELIQQTSYPVEGKIRMKLKIPRKESFVLAVRIPSWSASSSLQVNKKEVTDVSPGSYTTITRTWNDGDEIELGLDMRGRVKKEGLQPQFFAITRGPLLLSRDIRLGAPKLEETIQPVLNKEGFADLELSTLKQPNIWLTFNAKFKQESPSSEGNAGTITVPLCDYSSAGNTLNEHSSFKVWLPQLVDPTVK